MRSKIQFIRKVKILQRSISNVNVKVLIKVTMLKKFLEELQILLKIEEMRIVGEDIFGRMDQLLFLIVVKIPPVRMCRNIV